jgi:hypothetical protein
MSSTKKFGDIPFFTFYSTVLSRLAYFTSENFLPAYLDIFGPIISPSLMKDINDAPISKIFDSSIYKNTISNNKIPVYNYEGKNMIDFTHMALQINESNKHFVNRKSMKGGESKQINNSVVGNKNNLPITTIKNNDYTVAYISIATSNYSGYYILVDTRMPNSIFIVFRGTYSAKSAGSYAKPTSIVPFNIAKNIPENKLKEMLKKNEGKMFGVLAGINKILDDVYHSIIESMLYLSQKYLKQTSPNSVKVFTTGHSLGGALTTLFTNDWIELSNTAPYNQAPYNIFSKKICCVSVASPRVMSPAMSNYFCEQIANGNILYRRLTNRGDPVPALPQKSYTGLSEGYQHPCSAKKFASTQRQIISMDCGSTQKGSLIDYNKSLDCRKTKTSMFKGNLSGNVLAHASYLYINFINATHISDALSSYVPKNLKKKTTEITRASSGATNTRIILGTAVQKNNAVDLEFKSLFFTLNDLRPMPIETVDPNSKPVSSEDLYMNKLVFDDIIKNMQPMEFNDLNPVNPPKTYSLKVNKTKKMPKITGIYIPTTQRAGKYKTYKNKTRKMKIKKTRKYKKK